MIETKKIKVKGMTCNSCEKIILKSLAKIKGMRRIKVDYVTSILEVEYNKEKVTEKQIEDALEEKGYVIDTNSNLSDSSESIATHETKDTSSSSTLNLKSKISNIIKKPAYGVTIGIVGLLILFYFAFQIYGSFNMPQISQGMSYGLLFVVGLLTGFHCIGMCGGFVVSYTIKGTKLGKKPAKMHMSYGIGKTASYTIIGAMFGLLGSIIAFTPKMRGIAGILAGLFLVIYGVKMLNVIPALRKLSFKTPRFISKFVGDKTKENHNSPLMIGLLNGLMIACGPLQAIYIMAAGSGSMIEGAKMLFFFGLGTLPVMLGFGYLTTIISRKATHKILKVSGVIVILLGLIMINRGLALSGTGFDFNSLSDSITSGFTGLDERDNNADDGPNIVMKDGYQEIRMEVTRSGWSPNKFVLAKDVPTKWIIDAKELTGCNRAINIPKLEISFDLKQGEQIIDIPAISEEGQISWSCWMGMIPGLFVVEDVTDGTTVSDDALNSATLPSGGGCGMNSGGGCGCH
jgi:uncharacterized protein